MLERVNAPAATDELERRWAAIRDVMADAHVDALFVHSHVDGLGGATRWFADLPAGGGYPVSLVFTAAEPMTAIVHGPMGGRREIAPGDPVLRGIGVLRQTASFNSALYCDGYDAELALEALSALRPARVGIVGAAQIPWSMLDHLRRGLEGVDFVDARPLIDPIKAIKSPAEQAVLRETAAMQDAALVYAFQVVAPGMRESEWAAEVQRFCQLRGSEGGVYMVGSAPVGEPAMFQLRHHQERVIQDGDQLTFVVENSGAGGYYSHVGRMAILGSAPGRMLEEHAFAVDAQRRCVELLVDGALPADIAAAHDDHMCAYGRPPETRLLAHGQGYDLVERPLIRGDETMAVAAGMQIGVHPIYVHQGVFGYACDDYLITDAGAQRIHAFPQELVEL